MTTKRSGGKITGLLALTCEAQVATAVGDAVHVVGDYEVEVADGTRPILGRITVSNTQRISSVMGTSVGNPKVPGDVTVDVPGFFVSTEIAGAVFDAGEEVGIGANGKIFLMSGDRDAGAAAGTSEVQHVTVATSGNTTVGFQGVTAPATAITADLAGAAVLQGLLEGLPDIDPGDVAVAVGTAGTLDVFFQGNWADQDVPTLTATGTGAGVTTTTPGVAGNAGGSVSYIGLALQSALSVDDDVDVLWK